jgi:hypothetical protein
MMLDIHYQNTGQTNNYHEEYLKGYSGCEIILIRDGNSANFVRKISKDIAYNERLIIQHLKQKNFKNHTIKSPLIINNGYINKRFFFDMEYIIASNLCDILDKKSKKDIECYINIISKNILDSKQKSISTCDELKIYNKINDLTKFCNLDTIKYLKSIDWSSVPKSICHGDLTLENILIQDDDLYYIDFLDSFIDSWMIDVAKILQDTRHLWSFRLNLRDTTLIDNLKFLEYTLVKNLSLSKNELSIINRLTCLNLCRIKPYIKDKDTDHYITNEIKFYGKL